MKSSSTFLILLTVVSFVSTNLVAQDYLDAERKYMVLGGTSSDKDYGTTKRKAIKIGSRVAIGPFLNSLVPENGSKIKVRGLQDLSDKSPGLLKLRLGFEQSSDSITLFFLVSAYEAPMAPMGFRCKTLSDLNQAKSPISNEPSARLRSCSQSVFAANDSMLRLSFGALPKPEQLPQLHANIDSVRLQLKARVSQQCWDALSASSELSISLLVNCNALAGNYRVMTKMESAQQACTQEIEGILNALDIEWSAATQSNRSVDCYQVLYLHFHRDGRLDLRSSQN